MSDLPESASNLRTNLVGLASMFATTAAMVAFEVDPHVAVPLLMASAAVPILLLDVLVNRVHLRASTGLDFALHRPPDPRQIATRLVGAVAAIGAVAAFYWLTPEYQGSFYDPFYAFVRWFGPIALLVGGVYFVWVDRYLVDPHDAYWHLGAALTGRLAAVDSERIADLVRGWVIKGFFVPLMYVSANHNLLDLQKVVLHRDASFERGFDSAWHLTFLVDIVFTTMGYLLTFRLFDTHVRSAEPTMKGWVVALLCYQPFFSLVSAQYVMYEGGYYWGEWLTPYPVVKALWGAAILLLSVVFSACTVSFGCRFSNLTNRGVLTSGFYRWTRHPAYLSKCASYWLLFIPFVYNGSWYEVVRDCTWLTFICIVYWLRARTEERHLSRDPDYVRYALFMNQHSILAVLGRWFPFLAYRPTV